MSPQTKESETNTQREPRRCIAQSSRPVVCVFYVLSQPESLWRDISSSSPSGGAGHLGITWNCNDHEALLIAFRSLAFCVQSYLQNDEELAVVLDVPEPTVKAVKSRMRKEPMTVPSMSIGVHYCGSFVRQYVKPPIPHLLAGRHALRKLGKVNYSLETQRECTNTYYLPRVHRTNRMGLWQEVPPKFNVSPPSSPKKKK
ncbi:hypothetical protein K503DRAFT_786011 [Rhizopogon vinicolor AM-OR11-026]|uniref:Uncharacterized protein n=1 Tax=Rhizopogon vinicolor AM-OR11-026 TaxID=1314800 RepID=A0A1B7MNC0_9AGAM|nr:hypothetical protein K503DRAFT_786011 [Rhizopogon vinicolor AM-OR11-026]